MSEPEKSILAEFDKKYYRLLYVIYGLIIAMVGAGAFQLVTLGSTKEKVDTIVSNVETMSEKLKFVSGDYTPTWYMAEMTKLYNLHTEKIVAVLSGANQIEIKKIDDEFFQTVEIMQNNFIRMRGGMTNITRSLKASDVDKGSAK